MSGTAVIRAKLVAHAPLTALVASDRVRAGAIGQDVARPCIGITQINSTSIVNVTGAVRMHTDIVRVTVLVDDEDGAGYPTLQSILAGVRAACPHTRGTVATIAVDSILPGGGGPDVPSDQPRQLSGSRDFIVRWTD
jgi:hypothetical protein